MPLEEDDAFLSSAELYCATVNKAISVIKQEDPTGSISRFSTIAIQARPIMDEGTGRIVDTSFRMFLRTQPEKVRLPRHRAMSVWDEIGFATDSLENVVLIPDETGIRKLSPMEYADPSILRSAILFALDNCTISLSRELEPDVALQDKRRQRKI